LPKLNKEVYLTDTIGFIRNLPPQLVDAFKSTLFETVKADVIVHVIDISDEWVIEKIEVVQEILQELKIDPKKIIFVFNKSDTIGPFSRKDLQKKYASFSPQFVSAKTGDATQDLLEAIAEKLRLVTSEERVV
jgi:GTP-binding protein HflX